MYDIWIKDIKTGKKNSLCSHCKGHGPLSGSNEGLKQKGKKEKYYVYGFIMPSYINWTQYKPSSKVAI